MSRPLEFRPPARGLSFLAVVEGLLMVILGILLIYAYQGQIEDNVPEFTSIWRSVDAWFLFPGATWGEAIAPALACTSILLLIRVLSSDRSLWGRSISSAILLILAARYMLWRGLATLNFADGIALAIGLLLLGAEAIRMVEYSTSLFQSFLHPFLNKHRSQQADRLSQSILNGSYLPSVDVYIPTYNEPMEMLRRTVIGCQALDYPNKKVYLLDDGNRPAARALATELGCGYFWRDHGKHNKAGNLNNAIAQTYGEIICSFDCDFVPTRDFLIRTVGFFQDANVALVQTPKHFNNQEAIRYNLGVEAYMTCEEDVFYRAILPARDATNSFICHGSGYLVRRSVYEEIGGAPIECEVDDLYGSMKIQSRGYETVYLDEVLSAGDAPDTIHAFIDQRMRWAHACIQALYRPTVNPFILKGLSLMQRVHYSATIIYWFGIPGRLVFLLMPLIYALSPREVMHTTPETILYYWLPYFCAEVFMRNWINFGKRARFWSEVYDILMCVPMTMAVIQTIYNPFGKWSRVTPKGNPMNTLSVNWRITGPLLVLFLTSILGIVLPVLQGYWTIITPENETIILAWGGYNLALIAMALQASFDLPQTRRFLRFNHRLAYTLDVLNTQIEDYTIDLGEGGALLHAPLALLEIPHKAEARLTIPKLGLKDVRVSIAQKSADRKRHQTGVIFEGMTVEQQRKLIPFLFCRPGQWEEHSVSEVRASAAFLHSLLRLHPFVEASRRAPVRRAG